MGGAGGEPASRRGRGCDAIGFGPVAARRRLHFTHLISFVPLCGASLEPEMHPMAFDYFSKMTFDFLMI